MYRSQANQVLDMMENCENKADYRDLRRLMNRYLHNLNRWPNPVKSAYPWSNDTSFEQHVRDAGVALYKGIKNGSSTKAVGNKISLIKELRALSPIGYTNGLGNWDGQISLLSAKNFIEKYFSEYC